MPIIPNPCHFWTRISCYHLSTPYNLVSMHIAIYHDALIPPQKYGGTERMVFWLAKALAALGHRVSLIAKPGSQVPGVETIPYRNTEHSSWEDLVPPNVDIIHLRATPRTLPKKPFLVTIDGNGQPGEKFHSNTVFVSQKHAENHGSQYFVHNGIDPSDYESEELREDYFVFLAKASWKVKNLKGAVEIARRAGIEMKVMGSRIASGLPGLPPLSWRGIRYLGMVKDAEKKQVLKRARALLFPVRWHEPFGIAITEALASGCPVYGTPYGSLPEIITPDVGFLSNRAEELVEAVLNQKVSPAQCQARVRQGFTHLNMARRYLEFYQEILELGHLKQKADSLGLRSSFPADTLLPWFGVNAIRSKTTNH